MSDTATDPAELLDGLPGLAGLLPMLGPAMAALSGAQAPSMDGGQAERLAASLERLAAALEAVTPVLDRLGGQLDGALALANGPLGKLLVRR